MKKFEDRIKKIEKEAAKKEHGEKTPESILAEWKKSKEHTGMQLVTPEIEDDKSKVKKDTSNSTIISNTPIEIFLSVPHSQEWKKELRYDVLVTDDVGHRYDSKYRHLQETNLQMWILQEQ